MRRLRSALSAIPLVLALADGYGAGGAAAALDCVDPFIGTEGTGSQYGGMQPYVTVPFGSIHVVPQTRQSKIGRLSFNSSDTNLLGIVLTRQPAIWMGDWGWTEIRLPQPCPIESIVSRPEKTVVRAGGRTIEWTATEHAAWIRGDLDGVTLKDGVNRRRHDEHLGYKLENFGGWHAVDRPDVRNLRIGVSLISAEQARRNLAAEIPAGTAFETVVAATRGKWEAAFARLEIDAPDDVRTIFYTGLFHALLYPRRLDEDGRYYSAFDDRVHALKPGMGGYYNCFSLWDTYRAEHPLLTLIQPERVADMMNSLLTMYEEGGWLPKWPNPGYTGIMIGSPAEVVLAEACTKGFAGIDWNLAYAAAKKNATVPQANDRTFAWEDRGRFGRTPETRGGLSRYMELGYVVGDETAESVSRTQDFCLDDLATAILAEATGHADEAAYFRRRARNYTNLWNAAKGAFLPRAADGTFLGWDGGPTVDGRRRSSYCEQTCQTAVWALPFDTDGLAALLGGKEKATEKLDRYFETLFWKPERGNKSIHGNETSHHCAYLYSRFGHPEKTQQRVREILTRAYSTNRKGFDGNEDCGQMSAWYIFSALGFYPLDPATGEYELGSPLVRGARIRFAAPYAPAELEIRVTNYAPDRWRVRRVRLNGRELTNGRVRHADLVRGGVLEFEMEDGKAPVEPLPAFPDAKMPDVGENPIFSPIVPGGNRLFNSSFELGLCGWCLVCNTMYDKAAEGEVPTVSFDRTAAKHGCQSLKVDTRAWKRNATLNSHDCYGRPGEKLTFSAWVKAEKPVARVRASFGDATADFAANGSLSWYSQGGSLNIGTDWTRVSFTTRQPLNDINRKAVLKIDLPPGNVYWIDAAKVEVGEKATDYAPMAETESANVVKETVIVRAGGDGRHDFEFRGVDYRTDEVVVERRPLAVTRYGSQRLGGKWRGNWTLPEYVAVVHPLGKNPLRANPDDPGFFLGVNGGLVRSSISGGAVWLIGAAGVETSSDFAKLVRLGGNAMLRTQDIGCQWVDFEYERGVFKWDYLDQVLPAVAAADVEPLFVLGGSAFMAWVDPKKDGNRRDWYVRKNSREARKHGFYNAKKNTGAKSRVPSDDDWVEHLTGIYNHYKGIVNWYEPINEPNLQLADARDYTDLLKLSYRTLKGLDPKLKVVGICATGDFGGRIGEYVDAIGREGGFQHLDYMSFHPYNAPVDYLRNSAEKQLAAITALCEKYRPGVPRIQDEIYYLGDNEKNKGAFSGRNWPAGNIVRRAALDLAAGCVASISIHTGRYADGDACHPRHSNAQCFNFRFAPSDAYAAQNFCAYMLEGARRPRKPDLPEGLNGVTAVRPDGRKVAVIWFRQPGGSRTMKVPAGTEVYDLYGNPISGTSLTVTDDPVYLVSGLPPIRAGKDWIPIRHRVATEADSVMDFSSVSGIDAPAGKYGRLVVRDGHFAFERRPERRQRFYGANISGVNNFPDHETAVKYVDDLVRCGFNLIRLHHHDNLLVTDRGPEDGYFNADRLDRLDFLVAAAIRRGLYVTTDFYVDRKVTYRQLGIDREGGPRNNEYKELVYAHEGATRDLETFVRNFLSHVNPYTGRSYAQEPAFAWAMLVNEMDFGNHGTKYQRAHADIFLPKWKAYRLSRAKGDPKWGGLPDGIPDDIHAPTLHARGYMEFLTDLHAAFQRRFRRLVREELGAPILLTDMNGWNPMQSFARIRSNGTLDLVDQHCYKYHPTGVVAGQKMPLTFEGAMNPLGDAAGVAKVSAVRVPGLPFVVSEFNFCWPAPLRQSVGLLAGALAAAQDWDALIHFNFHHHGGRDRLSSSFEIAHDPVVMAACRALVPLFLRGDVSPLTQKAYLHQTPEVARRLEPFSSYRAYVPWDWLAWYAQIGTVYGERVPEGTTWTFPAPEAYGKGFVPKVPVDAEHIRSNGVSVDRTEGRFLLESPRTCGAFGPAGRYEAGELVLRCATNMAAWVTSRDGLPIAESRRLLFAHVTEGQDTDTRFGDAGHRVLLGWPKPPHLLAAGHADVSLRLAQGAWRLFAVDGGGARTAEIPATFADGRLSFRADVARDPASATFLYELVRKD